MPKPLIELDVSSKAVVERIKIMAARIKRPQALYNRIRHDQQAKTAMMFRRLAHGGTYRGVRWPWFAPQYRRKTDGVLVPAEGGVPRLDGKGVVLGRLRSKGGERVDSRSNLLRNTRHLSAAAATVARVRNHGKTLEIITPVKYAAIQQVRRPFTFFTRADVEQYNRWAGEYLIKKAAKGIRSQ